MFYWVRTNRTVGAMFKPCNCIRIQDSEWMDGDTVYTAAHLYYYGEDVIPVGKAMKSAHRSMYFPAQEALQSAMRFVAPVYSGIE